MSSTRSKSAVHVRANRYLRISDVSRLVGISPSILRSWENLGLVLPSRTPSGYRVYTQDDVRILKRAQFLRRARGMNAPAIAHLLKAEGVLSPKAAATQPASVGAHLRKLRQRAGESLAHVAAAVNVSVGFLSALERGQMTASVSTLRRLARFYMVNILTLFDPTEANPGVVRPHERKVLEACDGVRMELLSWGNTQMEPHLFRLAPSAGSGSSYAHEGEEFLFVIKGQLEISLEGGQAHLLEEGDSYYFQSTMEHRWRNPGKTETQVLWINTPPTF
ncbi:MAG TPA: cupin domain-containing protein [Candidatus Acidoferrum sp.]|nr:cupin domain-containing protein [Candidatus Acidoferrum sp.]